MSRSTGGPYFAAVVGAAGLTCTRMGLEIRISTVSVGLAAVVTDFIRLVAAVMAASAAFCFSAAFFAASASVAATFFASAAAAARIASAFYCSASARGTAAGL